MALTILAASFAAFLLLGVPVAFAIGLSALCTVLWEGLVLAVEPFLSTGATMAFEAADGWTLRTPDRSLSAQFEHTIVVTQGKPLVLTAT